jgi:hypothetical protein
LVVPIHRKAWTEAGLWLMAMAMAQNELEGSPQKNEGFNTKLRLRRFGGFHKYGYPNSWMVHNGKSSYKWM